MSRKTGPDSRTVELVTERAGGMCEVCGLREHQQTHHRSARRSGGTRDPAANYPSNLLAVCADCHRDLESNRAEALEMGWLVSSWESARDKPVYRCGIKSLLDDEGGWMICRGS